jgi:hypothetical protein
MIVPGKVLAAATFAGGAFELVGWRGVFWLAFALDSVIRACVCWVFCRDGLYCQMVRNCSDEVRVRCSVVKAKGLLGVMVCVCMNFVGVGVPLYGNVAR